MVKLQEKVGIEFEKGSLRFTGLFNRKIDIRIGGMRQYDGHPDSIK